MGEFVSINYFLLVCSRRRGGPNIGSNEVIDTSFENLGDDARRITGGYGADTVIDGVGREVLSEGLGGLAPGASLTTLQAARQPLTLQI
jgi:NADPH:quinone reductase-like Zn-dependent oxidoreductase